MNRSIPKPAHLLALAAFVFLPLSLRADISELQGHWKSDCNPGEVFGQTRTDEYIVNGSQQTQITTYYGDANCTRPIIEAHWAIEVVTGAEIEPGVRELNVTYKGVAVTAKNEAGSHVLESWGYCGINEWPVNEWRDITNRSGTERCVASLPVSNYTIYSVIDDKLYLGYGFSDDVSRRPATLNWDNPLSKMP